MRDNLELPQNHKRETVLRIMVLGAIYAAAVTFVVALSPSMGFISPHPVGEIGRVASAPEPAHTTPR